MKFIKNIKKEYLLILLVLIGITSLIIVNKNFSHKETVLDNVKLKYNVTNNKGMAIMLEKEDGSGYEESKSNTWPTDMVYNSELSGCMDSEGNKIEDSLIYNDSTKSVTVRTKKTAHCYLYFDTIKPSVKLTVSTNGVSNTLPTSGGYKANLTCKNATGAFSDKYQRLEISAINNTYSTCNLNYVTQSTSGYMKLSAEITRKQTLTTTNGGVCTIEENITQSACTSAGGYWYTVTAKTASTTGDVGVRFSGKDPANYVWFNNEMWRIIGLIPTCTASGCTSSANLVKIIRNDSIGAYAYDASTTTSSSLIGTWGNNTLKKLLNEFYYGKLDGTSNATGSSYCYGYYNSTYQLVPDCNFKTIGISSDSTDYYGRMIENVYWNTGASANTGTVSATYNTEVGTQTVSGYVGLMTASDYGYAGTDYSNAMNGSAFANNAGTNWLFGQGYEWTSIQYSSNTSYALYVSYLGILSNYNAYNGSAVRPVVYLDSSVYVISGDGTESNPYIIGM